MFNVNSAVTSYTFSTDGETNVYKGKLKKYPLSDTWTTLSCLTWVSPHIMLSPCSYLDSDRVHDGKKLFLDLSFKV